MSNEQLAEAIKNGENQYTAELWGNTYKLLYKLVGEYYAKYGERFTACGVTLEDVQQESYIAFVGMIKAYTPEKGLKFTTYAQLQIKIRMAELLGKRTEKKRPLDMSRSLDEPIQGIDGDNKYIIDTIEDSTAAEAFESTEADIFNTELKNALEKAMSEHLTAFQQGIITGRFYDNKTLSELGTVNGVSVEKIRDTEHKALRQLNHHKRELEPFREHFISEHSYHYTSLGSFRERQGSAQEIIIERLERMTAER